MRTSVLLLLAVILPATAYAAGAVADPHPSYTVKYWVNFTLFFGVIFYMLKRPFGMFWGERRDGIAAAVNKGKNELAAAETRLSEIKARSATLEASKEELKEKILSETQDEEKRIWAEAEAQAERIVEAAKASAGAERDATLETVRREIASEVIRRAEAEVRSEYKESDDRQLRAEAAGKSSSLSALIQ